MKYLLLICDEESRWSTIPEPERQKIMAGYRQFTEEIKASGHFLGGSQLQAATSATSVRVRGGKRLVTDGPFAETREQLAGYYLVQAKDLDEAIGLASRIPGAQTGTVEVRPLIESAVPAPV
jgi:hypothetical protein